MKRQQHHIQPTAQHLQQSWTQAAQDITYNGSNNITRVTSTISPVQKMQQKRKME
jgi:hypothetical protein